MINNDETKINVIFPDSVLPYIKMQCNDDFFIYETPPYIQVAEHFLTALSPKYCLELGAGIGRMSLYFYKRFNWNNTKFYLQDGDTGDIQYGGIRYSKDNEYYNSFDATDCFCRANGLENFSIIHDIETITDKIDFVYSFASIGFHWHINLYLDKLLPYLNTNTRLLFEIRAPKTQDDIVEEMLRHEYQAFYDSQINYANNHPCYQIIDIINLDKYVGINYKDKTNFLILALK